MPVWRFAWRTLWCVAVAALVVAGAPPTAPAAPGGGPERDPGVAIYRANYCGVCHELPAAGTRGTFGPSHVAMRRVAAARIAEPGYGGEAATPEAYILESILAPSAYLAPGYATSTHPMPSFAHLAEADVAALVGLLLAQ